MNIIAALRSMISNRTIEQSFVALIEDVIEKQILPPLERAAKRDLDKAAVAESYAELLDNPTKLAVFGQKAFFAVQYACRVRGVKDMTEDVAMQVIVKFYEQSLWRTFNTIDEGPSTLLKWFSFVAKRVAGGVASALMTIKRHETTVAPVEEGDYAESLPSGGDDPSDLLRSKEIAERLHAYIHKRFKGKPQAKYFDMWMKAMSRYGNQFKPAHLEKMIMDKTGLGKSSAWYAVQDLKKAIASFFETEYNIRMKAASSGRRIAARRWIAAWVLGRI